MPAQAFMTKGGASMLSFFHRFHGSQLPILLSLIELSTNQEMRFVKKSAKNLWTC
jgi:hypothetical protein